MTLSNTVYFVSGGSRGIGFQLVSQLSARANTTVIATATNPDKAAELQQLSKERGNIHVLKYEASSEEDAIAVGKQVGELVDGVDVFIPNAAIGNRNNTILNTSAEVFKDHYNVNVLGTILLFKALYPHLIKKDTRKVFVISSVAGSIGGYYPISISAYGQSKAGLNYSVKELSFELSSENFIVTAIHPGGVYTDMAKEAFKRHEGGESEVFKKLKDSMITPEESASKLIGILDKLKPEDNGTFLSYTGEAVPW